jgi:hypothetical protein
MAVNAGGASCGGYERSTSSNCGPASPAVRKYRRG